MAPGNVKIGFVFAGKIKKFCWFIKSPHDIKPYPYFNLFQRIRRIRHFIMGYSIHWIPSTPVHNTIHKSDTPYPYRLKLFDWCMYSRISTSGDSLHTAPSFPCRPNTIPHRLAHEITSHAPSWDCISLPSFPVLSFQTRQSQIQPHLRHAVAPLDNGGDGLFGGLDIP